MIENILFCLGFGMQILAWILAGGSFSLRPRRNEERGGMAKYVQSAKFNTFLLQRFLLIVGAGIFAISAYMQHEYVLLGAQVLLFVILWFRISLVREQKKREQ